MSREVELSRSDDAHFATRAVVCSANDEIMVTRTVVVCARNDVASEVCEQQIRMTRDEWLAVLPLIQAVLGVEPEVVA